MRPFREVKLTTPICDKDGKVVLDVLRVNKPLFGDLRRSMKDGKVDSFLLLSHCTGLSIPMLDRLELEDANKAGEAVEALMESASAGEP